MSIAPPEDDDFAESLPAIDPRPRDDLLRQLLRIEGSIPDAKAYLDAVGPEQAEERIRQYNINKEWLQ